MLLVYGKDGEYEPQLYLTAGPLATQPIAGTEVMHELPNELTAIRHDVCSLQRFAEVLLSL